MSAAHMGHKVTQEAREKQRRGMLGKNTGPVSDETRRRMSIANKRHSAKNLPSCRCFQHYSGNENPSQLSWKLINFLSDAGFGIIIPEVRFGRFSVDALLAEEWVAFEADGKYWHSVNKTDYVARDKYLLKEFGLPVIRISEEEINNAY